MKRGLSAIGYAIYGAVMLATVVIDLVIQFNLFAGGNIGGGLLYLFLGWTITLTIGHWIGMLLAAPFAIAGGAGSSGSR